MAIEGRGDEDFEAGMGFGNGGDEAGKVAFEVHAEGEEIGNDEDAGNAFRYKYGYSARERGPAQFEEGGLDVGEIAGTGEVRGDGADGFIGRLDAGAVSEDYDAGGHGGCK